MSAGTSRRPGRLRRFLALPPSERRLWLEAWWELLVADLRLRHAPGRALSESLEPTAPSASAAAVDPALPRAVASAASHHLWSMSCLPRALALRRLLSRRRLDAQVRIGVRKEAGRLLAHAWVECGGVALGEPTAIEERFLPLLPPSALDE